MSHPPAVRIGLALSAFLAVTDVAGLLGLGGDAGPPVAVVVAGALLGVITLAAVRPAWRRQGKALLTVVVTRVVSALLGVPAFFVHDKPSWVVASVIASLVLTAIAVVLLRTDSREVVA
jgi:hypothetical protein